MQSQKFLPLLLGLSFVLLLGACKRDGETRQADESFEVTVRLPSEPDRLNPLTYSSAYALQVFELTHQPLMNFNPETLQLDPVLIESRPAAADITEGLWAGGVAYTFKILDEAVWDNGQPVTGHDVAFSLKALFNPHVQAQRLRPYLEMVREVRVDPDDPRRFTVLTDQKYILGEAAVSNVTVLPEYAYDPDTLMRRYTLAELTDPALASRWENDTTLIRFAEAFNGARYAREPGYVVGSGPYRLVEWVSGERLVLEKKEGWWGDALADRYPMLVAHPSRVLFKVIPDASAAALALRSEGFDVSAQMDVQDFLTLRDDPQVAAKYNFFTPPTNIYYFIYLNMRNPKLSDRRVRRALAHLVDVDAIIEQAFNGLGIRTNGPVHPDKEYYDASLPLIDYDPEEARRLLAEAGWTDTNGNGIVDKELNGRRVELELQFTINTGSKFAEELALMVQEQARRGGVAIEVTPKEVSALRQALVQRDFELAAGAFAADPVLYDDLKQLYHSTSDRPDGFNRFGIHNPELDQVLDEIQVTLDKDKLFALYRKMQRIIYEEQPQIFLFIPQERIVIHKRFEARASARKPGYYVPHFRVNEEWAQSSKSTE